MASNQIFPVDTDLNIHSTNPKVNNEGAQQVCQEENQSSLPDLNISVAESSVLDVVPNSPTPTMTSSQNEILLDLNQVPSNTG